MVILTRKKSTRAGKVAKCQRENPYWSTVGKRKGENEKRELDDLRRELKQKKKKKSLWKSRLFHGLNTRGEGCKRNSISGFWTIPEKVVKRTKRKKRVRGSVK